MSTVTKIEWSDRTWSPLLGCDRVSPGCDHCYAIRTVNRLAHNPNEKVGPLYEGLTHETDRVTEWRSGLDWTGIVRTVPGRLDDPLAWRKPQRVFVNSQADLFHKDVTVEFIAEVFGVMAAVPRHMFQILTKRHARMRSVLSDPAFRNMVADFAEQYRTGGWQQMPWPLPNVWMGVSVEDQRWADVRVPALLQTPAAVRWVSAEPLLGPVDFEFVGGLGALSPDWAGGPGGGTGAPHQLLDWIVVGTESGPGARPLDLAWVEQIVGDCQSSVNQTAVFVKQLPTGQNGKATQDMSTFPVHLRVREYPAATA
jgi:protein gp37